MPQDVLESWREAFNSLFGYFEDESDIVIAMSELIDIIEEEAETRIIDLEMDNQLKQV